MCTCHIRQVQLFKLCMNHTVMHSTRLSDVRVSGWTLAACSRTHPVQLCNSDLQVASRPRTAVPCWWPAIRYRHSRQITRSIECLTILNESHVRSFCLRVYTTLTSSSLELLDVGSKDGLILLLTPGHAKRIYIQYNSVLYVQCKADGRRS